MKLHIKPAALRRLRLELAMTREQLSEEAGIGKGTLDHYEAGTRTACRPETVQKLARVFDVEPEIISVVRGTSTGKARSKLQSA